MCVLAFLVAGCNDALSPEEQQQQEQEIQDAIDSGELTEEEAEDLRDDLRGGINLDGVLVLRRPLDAYDFDGNVPDDGRNYYQQYSANLLATLLQVYGNLNYNVAALYNYNAFEMLLYANPDKETLIELNRQYQENPDDFIPFYDAMRYQITDVQQVGTTIHGSNGLITIDGTVYSYTEESPLTLTPSLGSAITEDTNGQITVGGTTFTYALNNGALTLTSVAATGVEVTANTNYGWNWSVQFDAAAYRPWLYAYNGEQLLPDGTVTAEFDNNDQDFRYDFETFESYYTNAFRYTPDPNNPEEEFLSFDQAAFNNAFVNTEYQTALEYAIYCIVLGQRPNAMDVTIDQSGNVTVTVEGYAAQTTPEVKSSVQLALEDKRQLFNELGSYVGLTQTNKTYIAQFILDEIIGEAATGTALAQNVLMYEDVVEAIVEYAGTLTTIGQTQNPEGGEEDGDPTYVGDNFIASEMATYPLLSFMSNMDGDNFLYTGEYEYQSFVIMPSKEDLEIGNIMLDFKYDAGRDGDEIVDPNAYLDLEVSVRWWDVRTDEAGTVISKEMRVITVTHRIFDGAFDAGEDGSTLDIEVDLPENQGGFGETIKVGKFTVPDALKPTSGLVTTITGLTDARKYYQVLESSTYGGYGVLNQEMFEFSYCEVAFNVAKAVGDTDTNYAFYLSLASIYEPLQHENDPEWH